MAFSPKAWLDAATKVNSILELESGIRKILEKHAEEIQELKDRLTKLEAHVQAREEIMVAEAKSAAGSVTSTVASQHIAAISQAIGRLEGHMEATGRLLPRKQEP